MSVSIQNLEYFSRFGWVASKQALGLPSKSDKTFFVERLSRLLRSNRVAKTTKVLALGKEDGAGSQALGAMSAINFARAHTIRYVHKPFRVVEHAEPGIENWAAKWESYFNLGRGELSVATCAAPMVPIEKFLRDPSLWQQGVTVCAEHFLHYALLEPQSWGGVRDSLQSKYSNYKAALPRSLKVAVHVRRGDVSLQCSKTARSFTPNHVFLKTLEILECHFRSKRMEFVLDVYSQGEPEQFREFAELGCRLWLDEPAIDTHEALVNADVLLMSKSGFSYTAGLLCKGTVLYDPQKYPPAPWWILRDSAGTVAGGALDRIGSSRHLQS